MMIYPTSAAPKDFYDLDGDGHLDEFESTMMLFDTADELEELNKTPIHYRSPEQENDDTGLAIMITLLFFVSVWALKMIAL